MRMTPCEDEHKYSRQTGYLNHTSHPPLTQTESQHSISRPKTTSSAGAQPKLRATADGRIATILQPAKPARVNPHRIVFRVVKIAEKQGLERPGNKGALS